LISEFHNCLYGVSRVERSKFGVKLDGKLNRQEMRGDVKMELLVTSMKYKVQWIKLCNKQEVVSDSVRRLRKPMTLGVGVFVQEYY
jgi:hypothetical protein